MGRVDSWGGADGFVESTRVFVVFEWVGGGVWSGNWADAMVEFEFGEFDIGGVGVGGEGVVGQEGQVVGGGVVGVYGGGF